eukprot:TRINITY_DN17667_c0_g1_i3.p1 TRINITY_DN17667_c0_g1~~TRINITY_DN17667_c0_g1_i3.p1  ORF type:complete len:182 (-),score=27.74 TRINITY_DN17667_c0_g1_i3:199-744(-)
MSDTNMRHNCIIRCLQAHSLLGLHDKYDAPWYALDTVFDAWELEGCSVPNPIQCIMREVVWRARLQHSYTRGPSIISKQEGMVDGAQWMPQDKLQGFVDSIVPASDIRYLSFESTIAPRLQHGRMRDLSPIAFYACRVIDSTTLLTGTMPNDSIPHTPSSVRFVEALMLCCGYGLGSSSSQ